MPKVSYGVEGFGFSDDLLGALAWASTHLEGRIVENGCAKISVIVPVFSSYEEALDAMQGDPEATELFEWVIVEPNGALQSMSYFVEGSFDTKAPLISGTREAATAMYEQAKAVASAAQLPFKLIRWGKCETIHDFDAPPSPGRLPQ
jgi:hypothetical protein